MPSSRTYYTHTMRNVLALYRWATGPASPLTVQIDWATTYTQAQARAFLLRCVMVRCNRGLLMTGRKWGRDYQVSLQRDARIIRDAAHRIRWAGSGPATPELARRFPAVVAFCRAHDD